ncbi:MAG: disulfide bond formation protein B [Sulfitobacter sp.]|nr:disulfide bond formation protein B [Sulfitobacter sp.]
MTARTNLIIATLGSAALLLGAFAFQHLGGLAPCKMCLWQRWPHAAAVLIGLAILAGLPRSFAWAGALAALTTALIGAFHAGVEWGFWEGPSSCTGGGGGLGSLSGADLLSTEGAGSIVMCDEIVWQMAGLSMAGWNAVLSLVLVFFWVRAARA